MEFTLSKDATLIFEVEQFLICYNTLKANAAHQLFNSIFCIPICFHVYIKNRLDEYRIGKAGNNVNV